jgi:protein-tyrosine-phosphatase/DNA-binding HxlR family transcriptional regulator
VGTRSSSTLGERAARHAALGDSVRLAIAEELVASDRGPSELRRRLGIESNLLAHHLGALERVGLVDRVTSDGDARRRYVRLTAAGLAYTEADRVLADAIVFVCTANSARSQLAAALWNSVHEVPATSAGTHPATRVHPRAVAAAATAGLDLRGARPQAMDSMGVEPDLVVTVCDRAHEELARAGWRQLHWSIPDPVTVGRQKAFDATVEELRRRVELVGRIVQPRQQGSRPARRTQRARSR